MVKNINLIGEFQKKLGEKKDAVMFALSQQVLADCNLYARRMSGDMIDSSHIPTEERQLATDLQKGSLVWNTSYATKVYYEGGTVNTQENPRATRMWCETARLNHKADWIQILKNAIKENCIDD